MFIPCFIIAGGISTLPSHIKFHRPPPPPPDDQWVMLVFSDESRFNLSTMNFKLLKSFDNQLIWCDVSTGHNRPYLTAKFRRKVFSSLHGLGHPSHRATKPLINTRFVWHGMNIDIARWCRSCKGCQTAKVSRHNTPVFGKFTEPTYRAI